MTKLILPEHVKKEVDKEGSNVLPFGPKAATGGGDPPSGDWLSSMAEGTIFLCHPKNKETVQLQEYHVLYQLQKSTHLLLRDPTQGNQDVAIYVNPKLFCQHIELYEVIMEPPVESE